jgi:hypothetical protein
MARGYASKQLAARIGKEVVYADTRKYTSSVSRQSTRLHRPSIISAFSEALVSTRDSAAAITLGCGIVKHLTEQRLKNILIKGIFH